MKSRTSAAQPFSKLAWDSRVSRLRSAMRRPVDQILVIVPLVACLFFGCSRGGSSVQPNSVTTQQQGIVDVYVVNYPLQYFAQRIGGKHARVVFPAPPDEDPAFWRPGADAIANFQRADLILLNGAAYAKWLKTVTLPESKLVDTSSDFADQFIEVANAVTHSHGPGAQHAHAGIAFTTWLDPKLAIRQAEAIRVALTNLRPQYDTEFQQGFDSLKSDLEQLDRKLEAAVKDKSDRAICFSHPVFQYFQRRYQLNAKSVHWEPDAVPAAKLWNELASLLADHPARSMIWEGEPIDENVRRLEELGLRSSVFNPCGNVPDEGDYLSVMRQNIENLSSALGEQ